MQKMFSCYCRKCGKGSMHDIYISRGGYLHAVCSVHNWDKSSDAEMQSHEYDWEGENYCTSCGKETHQFRYTSKGGYIHWFCCGCGKDKSSDAQVR